MKPAAFAALAISVAATFSTAFCVVSATENAGILMYSVSFEDFGFFADDYIARSGTKTIAERGMTLEPGRWGLGLKMNRIPDTIEGDALHVFLLDPVTRVKYYSESKANLDNEPFIWGAGKLCPSAGSVAFWVKGALREGELFKQAAINWGRKEQYLLAVTVDGNGCPGAYLRDAGYVWRRIQSRHEWDSVSWNHIVFNWDRAQGLELFVNGESAASSWGRDAWWESFAPGLMSLPMPGVVYDELRIFARPLSRNEIIELMAGNTPPAPDARVAPRSEEDRDRLAAAYGLNLSSGIPVAAPSDEMTAIRFSEIVPVRMGDGHIPARFAMDGRYELAWPHPVGVFTWVPGDADFQAEKIEIEPPPGMPFNYVTVEGNMRGMPSSLTDWRKDGDRYTGADFFSFPQDGRFFHGALLTRAIHKPFMLPFLKGYGAPEEYTGDVRLPLTGETRIHEIGLFDVLEESVVPIPGETVYHLDMEGDGPGSRCDMVFRTLYSACDRTVLNGYRTPRQGTGVWMETGLLRHVHIFTEPLSGPECIDGILLDIPVRTRGAEDVLTVRLRDPGLPHRIWTHAEVKLRGFGGEGGRLRLLLNPVPLLAAGGDVIWLEITTLDGASILVGGDGGATVTLRPSHMPMPQVEREFESKALMPAMAEYMKAPHHLPWMFEKVMPDIDRPHAFGGHFDSLLPALAVKRVLPYSRLAEYYVEFCSPRRMWANFWEPERNFPVKPIDVPDGVPRWAYLQRTVQHFRHRVAAWIAANQNPDGQFGGGMNDDILIFRNKFDMALDGCDYVRDAYVKVYEALDDTKMFADGYCRILPTDTGHVDDLVRYRFYLLLYKLGDPFIYRRALETAWHWDKPESTPLNYRNGSSFLFDRNILEWYWGSRKAEADYVTPHPDSLDVKLSRLVSYLDDLMYHRFTEARIHTDRQTIDYEYLVGGMIVGGWGMFSGQDDLSMSVAWMEGGGVDLARWVTKADDSGLTCRMFSFDRRPRRVTARLFRIRDGNYEITLSEDADGLPGALIDRQVMDMRRLDTLSVEVPPGVPVILTVSCLDTYTTADPLPDLAVASYDCERQGSLVRVRVSNLGAARSNPSTILVTDSSGRRVGEADVPALDAPVDFVEKSVWVEVNVAPAAGALTVTVDPANLQREIYKGNNSAILP